MSDLTDYLDRLDENLRDIPTIDYIDLDPNRVLPLTVALRDIEALCGKWEAGRRTEVVLAFDLRRILARITDTVQALKGWDKHLPECTGALGCGCGQDSLFA